VIGLAACAGRVGATALYSSQLGVDTPTGPTNDYLYQFDQTTGVASVVGKMRIAQVLDLASDWRPESARLWAANFSDNSLYRLGADGGATLVGSFGTAGSNNVIHTLAFDPITNRMFGTTNISQDLYQIDPATGAATRLAHITVPGALTVFDVDALACDLEGNLWGAVHSVFSTPSGERLFIIDPSTGAASLRGITAFGSVHDIAFRPEDDAMFLTSDGVASLYRVDTRSGAVTPIGHGNPGLSLYGLGFVDLPEPTSLLSMVASMLLVGRRGRRA
jgi:Repeat of unknown function (DUF6923)